MANEIRTAPLTFYDSKILDQKVLDLFGKKSIQPKNRNAVSNIFFLFTILKNFLSVCKITKKKQGFDILLQKIFLRV